MQKKQMLCKARIYRINGKHLVIWKGREITLQELRNEITKLIVEEMKQGEAARQ